MATPPDSPGPEEALFDFESARARQQTTRPVALEELLRQTKFSRQEIRVMYRGFKQVSRKLNNESENTADDAESVVLGNHKWGHESFVHWRSGRFSLFARISFGQNFVW